MEGDAIYRIGGKNWACGEHIRVALAIAVVGRVLEPFMPFNLTCSKPYMPSA